MTGHVHWSNKEHLPPGLPIWFRVFDDGPDGPDSMTYLLFEGEFPDSPWPTDCHDDTLPLYGDLVFPLMDGRVRVSGG